jgi:hypothetical protein
LSFREGGQFFNEKKRQNPTQFTKKRLIDKYPLKNSKSIFSDFLNKKSMAGQKLEFAIFGLFFYCVGATYFIGELSFEIFFCVCLEKTMGSSPCL